MKLRLLILLLALSTSAFAQKLKLPGFGDVSAVKTAAGYSVPLGKLGKFEFSGTIKPLSLSTSIGMESLKAFPAASVLSAVGVEDIELSVAKKGVEIAANIGNKFKEKIKKKVKGRKVLSPVIGTILNTLDIRDSQIALLFEKGGKLGGSIELNIYVFNQRLPIPKLSAKLDIETIVKTVVDAIADKGLKKIGEVGKAIVSAATKSGKIVANAAGKALGEAKTVAKHAHHLRDECNKSCVPNRARKLGKAMRLESQRALGEFYNNVIPTLKDIQGETEAQTVALRKAQVQAKWNELLAQIENGWGKVRGDRKYVRFYIKQSSAEKGGRIYRAKVDEEKTKFYAYRDQIWDRLLHEKGFELTFKDIYMIRSKSSGQYWGMESSHFAAEKINGKIIQAPKDKLLNGTTEGADRLIKAVPNGRRGELTFQPQHSKYFAGFSGSNYLKLVTQKSAQGFKKRRVTGESNTYYLINPQNGHYLTATTSGFVLQPFNEQDNQKWVFEWAPDPYLMAPPPTSFRYAIKNVMAKKYINAISERVKQGANLKPFKVSKSAARKSVRVTVCSRTYGKESPDQYFRLYHKPSGKEHYYQLKPMLGQNVLNVMDGNIKDGTPLELWKRTNELKEQFKFIWAGEPMTYFIQERNGGKFLQVPNSNHGAPVQISRFTGKDNQKWNLEAYFEWVMPPANQNFYIKSVYCNNEYWDPDGNKCNRGDKIKNWAYQEHSDRRFKIVSANDHSWVNIISSLSGRALDVPAASNKNGTQLQLWDRNGLSNQKFALEFTSPSTFRIYSTVGKYLDVEGDSENGDSWKDDNRKIQINHDYYVRDRHFQLIYADGRNKGRPYYFDAKAPLPKASTVAAPTFKLLKNGWENTFINIERGPVALASTKTWHSAQWVIEPVAGTNQVRIKNRWKNTYLNMETGSLKCTEAGAGWLSAKWVFEKIPGTTAVRIKNAWKGTYLNNETGRLQCTKAGKGWLSAMWFVENAPK